VRVECTERAISRAEQLVRGLGQRYLVGQGIWDEGEVLEGGVPACVVPIYRDQVADGLLREAIDVHF